MLLAHPACGAAMVFSQIQFLFYFLPIVLLAYFVIPRGMRNGSLVVASLLFYAWGSSDALWILATSIAVNHLCGYAIFLESRDGPRSAKLIAAAGIAFNLVLLAYFKYANFLVAQSNIVLRWTGALPMDMGTVALPVGISFYTFHSMSYLIDVYRRATPAFTNPLDYALYVTFFPQLIAGPIIRFKQIAPQIRQRSTQVERFGEGAVRFCFGLAKKVLVADPLGEIVQAAFALPTHQLDSPTAWIGALAYTFQLYFDFSGYSDMAIGLGRMFGFEFPENFWRPYSAVSITDFWRRWHMTLSAWFRDYLYFPLGGSQRSTARTYMNLGIVFLATGLWHGANWTFVIWGAYHGGLLIIERVTGQRPTEGFVSHRVLRQAVVFALVLLGWVMFRSDSIEHAAGFYEAMFAFERLPPVATVQAALTTRNLFVLMLAPLILFLPRQFSTGVWLVQANGLSAASVRAVVMLVLFPLSVIGMISSDFHPFLYFRF